MYVKKKMFLSGMGDAPYPYPAPPPAGGGDTVANIIADIKSLFGSNTPPVPPYTPGAPLPGMPGSPGVPYAPVSTGPDMTIILLVGGLAVGAYYLVKK